MTSFDRSDIPKYLAVFLISMTVAYLGSKFRYTWQSTEQEDEHKIIRQYLLNESPLYGHNKPKLWIHTTYEVNARSWKSFFSRNTTDLNQPYIHLTVKSIINHCADDFNICLIDDHSFSKLIPHWSINIAELPEPIRTNARELGLAELLYIYGGMVVPNSFICMKPLKPLFDIGTQNNTPFVLENVNHIWTNGTFAGRNKVSGREEMNGEMKRLRFIPDCFFMGARKNDKVIYEYTSILKKRNKFGHFTSEAQFLGSTSQWMIHEINEGHMKLIDGECIGVKTTDKKTVLLEELMEENFLDISADAYGVYIPASDVLKRPKYQWFASLNGNTILNSNMIVSKYLASSIVDSYQNVNRIDGDHIPSHNWTGTDGTLISHSSGL